MSASPPRVLPYDTAPASVQIAAGSAMLAGLEHGGPAMRWYAVDRPAALLGMSQQQDLLDAEAVRAAGVGVHRRPSGGGLVLADELLLMLDLALPHGHPRATADLTESYRWLGEAVAEGLRALGGAVRVLPVAEARADAARLAPPLASICFAGRSPYEVLAGERKIVGLAQVRRRPGALFQVGVYTRWEPHRTAALIAIPPSQRAALEAALASRVAGLDDVLAQPPVAQDVMDTVGGAIMGALERSSGKRPGHDRSLQL